MADPKAAQKPVTIKKYANRRLYDTETSAYITLEDLCDRVKAGRDFIVVDAKTGQDLTRQVLTQIIFEQETKGLQILPTSFLRDVIRMYDHKMQDVLQHYLTASMQAFTSNQERMTQAARQAMQGLTPLNQFEEMTRQNVAFFEKAAQMFNPFGVIFSGNKEEK
ncbi:MAG: polyhydroxyalkanoate synthesis repressor PhaR [Alphaproteobacteria bacterium]|nr:polyhydroxyalkanoate synthesis repressor PhaR [Alphaproteobacteria bacterium]